MLYPGMTEWETFYVPFAADHAASAIVTYSQNGIVLIKKTVTTFIPVEEPTQQSEENTEQQDETDQAAQEGDSDQTAQGENAEQTSQEQSSDQTEQGAQEGTAEQATQEEQESTVPPDRSYFEVHLTQQDTLRLTNNCKTIIQINVMTDDGERYTSDPIFVTTGIQSYRTVMT